MSIFYGLNISKNSLIAQNSVLNVVSHNVANADTPGYSKQNVILTSNSNDIARGMQLSNHVRIGDGVEAQGVQRSRSALYDQLYRAENQDYNYFKQSEELLHQVELLFDEPSDEGLSSIIDDFFNGWHDLANEPQNTAARESLKSIAQEMSSRMHRIYSQLETMQKDINSEIASIPDDINETAAEIVDLNVAIRITERKGDTANDLRDKRDHLVDQLSQFSDVRVVEQDDSTYTILLGSQVIVNGDTQTTLSAKNLSREGESTSKTVILSPDGVEHEPVSGTLGALIRVRDEYIAGIKDKMNKLAESLVTSVNFEHRIGYGLDGNNDRNFFDPTKTKAFNLDVSIDIQDVNNIAVSGDGTVGNNDNAMKIINIQDVKTVDNQFTINEYYNALISNIGIITREAKSGRENEQLLVSQIDNSRESIKGVNIDEELIQMIQAQRIYQGSSRLIVVLDTLLESVLAMK